MSGTQTNNLFLLDLITGHPRTIETGGSPDDLEIGVDVALIDGASLHIHGNLIVDGTTSTVETETILTTANHIYMNNGYTTPSAEASGLVANYLPTATADTVAATGFVAGVPAGSNPVVFTTGSATFAAGDLIQVSGANTVANNGLFEVLTHIGTELTITGIGTAAQTFNFTQNQFTTDAVVAGAITLLNVSVLQAGTDGSWEGGQGASTVGWVFTALAGATTLNEAYDNGNTITTDATGNVIIAGTQALQITTTNGLDLDTSFDFDGISFDVLMAGTNGFSIDGTATSNIGVDTGDLSLATTTSGNIILSSVANVIIDGTNISIDGTAASNLSVTGANLTLSTLSSGTLAISSVGTLDLDGNSVTLDATSGFSIDAAAAASNVSLAATGAAQDLTIALTGAQDSSLVLSSTGTGGDALQITASAGGIDITVETTNANALDITDGSNTYITIDSNDVEVDIRQFLNLSTGGGVTLIAGATLAAGEAVRIDASGEWQLADANSGTTTDGLVVGVAVQPIVATNPAQAYTLVGSLVPMLFGAAPAGASNGNTVWLSTVAGEVTLTPPTGPGEVLFSMGILQGADGADPTPLVLFNPQLVAVRP